MDKRQTILNATAQLITQHGLQSVPMSRIAQQAGVGVGTIYRYFADKEALIKAVYTDLAQGFARSLPHPIAEGANEGIADSEDSPQARFSRFWRGFLEYYLTHPERAALLDYLGTSPYLRGLVQDEAYREATVLLESIFADAQAQGLLRESVNVPLALNFIYGGLTTVAKKNAPLSAEALEEVLTLAWHSICQ